MKVVKNKLKHNGSKIYNISYKLKIERDLVMGKLYREPSERRKRPLPSVVERTIRYKRMIRGDKIATEKLKEEERKNGKKVFKLFDLVGDMCGIVEDTRGNSYYCEYPKRIFEVANDNTTIIVYFNIDEERDYWIQKKFRKSFLTYIEEIRDPDEDEEEDISWAVSKVAIDAKYESGTTTEIIEEEPEPEPPTTNELLEGYGFDKFIIRTVHPTISIRLLKLCKYLGVDKVKEIIELN